MAEFTEAEMMQDLARADAAGDAALAQHIAGRIRDLRAKASTPKLERVSRTESGARGVLQGASFGFGDEAAGAVAATLPFTDRGAVGSGQTWGDRYRNARDFYRSRNEAASQANPGTYLTGQITGAVMPTLIGAPPASAAQAMKIAAGQGAAQGAGYSDASSLGGLAGDSALGAGVGLAGYGAGALLGKGAAALRRKAGEILARAQGKATEQAAAESAEAVASAAGKLGGEVQKGSRYIENLLRLESAGTLTAAQQAELAALRANGTIPALAQSVAQGTLEALPGQAATIAARKAELAALQQGAESATAARATELLKPSVRPDARSFLKSYAEPLAWAYAGKTAGDVLGLDTEDKLMLAGAAGLVGGRTRAGKALVSRLRKPGNQATLADAMSRAAARVDQARRPVQAGITAELIAALEGREP